MKQFVPKKNPGWVPGSPTSMRTGRDGVRAGKTASMIVSPIFARYRAIVIFLS